MADQEEKPTNQESHVICDQCLYEQLSEDWRHRDRITWQLPAVLVVVGGLLLGGPFGIFIVDPRVKNWLLLVGFVFACLLTIMLVRNLYLQAVGNDLMETIRNVGTPKKSSGEVDKARRGAQRIPQRRTGYRFGDMLKDPKPISSVFLVGLCLFIAGLFAYLLFDSCWWFAGGSLISLVVALVLVCYSYRYQKV